MSFFSSKRKSDPPQQSPDDPDHNSDGGAIHRTTSDPSGKPTKSSAKDIKRKSKSSKKDAAKTPPADAKTPVPRVGSMTEFAGKKYFVPKFTAKIEMQKKVCHACRQVKTVPKFLKYEGAAWECAPCRGDPALEKGDFH